MARPRCIYHQRQEVPILLTILAKHAKVCNEKILPLQSEDPMTNNAKKRQITILKIYNYK